MSRKTKLSLESRFLKDRKLMPNGCIEWQGALNKGYGFIHSGGKNIAVHRLAYELYKGPIVDGLYVLHKCNNPKCSNPDHLYLGTPKQNSRDRWISGRLGHNLIAYNLTLEQLTILASYTYTEKEKQELTGLSKGTIYRTTPLARNILSKG